MTTIKEHSRYYDVIDENCKITQYSKDDITDLNLLCQFLLDEYLKADEQRKINLEKFWEVKKQLNQITDIIDENRR